MGVENIDVSGGHCYMNSHTISESKIHNSIDYTKNSDENAPSKSER